MSLWAKIETAPASAAFFSWKMRFGKALPSVLPWFIKKTNGRARTVPCPHGCGCIHRVTEENFGVCNCGDCEPIPLTAEDVQVWEPSWPGLGSQVRAAFDLEHKTCGFPVSKVWQVGSFGGDALQVVLVVLPDRAAFNEALAQLVARVQGRFVVVTPTSAHHDIESRELLGRVKAGLVDLESSVTILGPGRLAARKSAGELFSAYLPENGGAENAAEIPRLFAILMKLKSKRAGMKAPLYDVFVRIVFERLSQKTAAAKCECSEALVSARVKELEREFGSSLEKLKAAAAPLLEMETAVKGPRSRKRAVGSQPGATPEDEDRAPSETYVYDGGSEDA